MIKFYLLLSSILLFSCFGLHRLNYLGVSSTPTKTVDVYVDASSIKRPYTIMGKSFAEIMGGTTLERVQEISIKKAKEKGADAVLFQDYIVQDGGSIQTVSDTNGKASIRVRTTRTTPFETTRLDILFLKYD